MADEDETLVDYDEDEQQQEGEEKGDDGKEVKKGAYVGIHTTGFKDFILKPELMRAVQDCGFEHPSEVQHECIPQAVLGMDVICQAKSGMGKTAVFVLTTLHQIEPKEGEIACLVLCHTRELAYQIQKEYERFAKYLPDIRCSVFFGGTNIRDNLKVLKEACPHIIVGTPGRILGLTRNKDLDLTNLKHFVLDECDQLLVALDMRRDVQQIFAATPHDKQVMMFSATLSKEIRPVCKKFCQEAMEIYIDNETKLTLHGLQQHYIQLEENQKNRKLNDLLDALEFNQVVIFVSQVKRAKLLNQLLEECSFPSICIHSALKQEERIARYKAFKNFEKRIMVSTDVLARGIDIERVNIVINYDFPTPRVLQDGSKVDDDQNDIAALSDTYLHRVGRAGRFGTKGLAISFISSESDTAVLAEVQRRFEVEISELPDEIDISTYMNT